MVKKLKAAAGKVATIVKEALSGIAAWFPTAKAPFLELVDVGSRYSEEALRELAGKLLAKWPSHDFASVLLDATWKANLEQLVLDTQAKAKQLQSSKDAALPTGVLLDQKAGDAKAWRRWGRTVCAIHPDVAGKLSHAGTGSSVRKLAKSIRDLLPLVERVAGNTAVGAQKVAQGRQLLDDLAAAVKAHGEALGALSPDERMLNAQKGVIYEELKRLSRAARYVCPSEASLFALRTHLQAHHSRHTVPQAPGNTGTSAPAA